MNIKRILMVEDSPNDAELTLEALAEYNLANLVEHVKDGQEALDYLFRKNQFADRPECNPVVILLDLKLPKVDGFEVLKAIRCCDSLKHIPVVILTSSNEDRDRIKGYDLGINAYVVKPVNFHEFIDAVKHLGIFWAIINQPPQGKSN